nr:MAG TPA: hypothetical protein [Caudoviricetes sp.]
MIFLLRAIKLYVRIVVGFINRFPLINHSN